MITLLQLGGGASDFSVEGHALSPADWLLVKNSAARLLTARHSNAAAELLSSEPWELRKGTNGFGDDFEVLYRELPLAEFVAIEAESPQLNASLRQIAQALFQLRHPLRFVGIDLRQNTSPSAVVVPTTLQTSELVEAALNDAEASVASGRPQTAVDRAHTALHGYLKTLCLNTGTATAAQCDTIQACLHHLRTQHPNFTSPTQDESVRQVLRSLVSVAGAFNSVRNNATLAHPVDGLLQPAEAMLCINAMRTLLRYVHDKTAS
jgi:hypothetical protein